jgi:hypothetical protein
VHTGFCWWDSWEDSPRGRPRRRWNSNNNNNNNNKWDWGAWNGLSWFRIVTGGGNL